MQQKTEQEIKQAIADQAARCREMGWPNFAPGDGFCYNCRKNIYQNYSNRTGWTGKSAVTGCPHCNISYID